MSPELHSLVGPYVLDALDDGERRDFEDHLERCPTCQADVAELLDVPAALARSVAEPVPDSLRRRVLDQVDATRQDRSVAEVARPRAWRRAATGIATAVAVAALVAAVVGIGSWRQADRRADVAESALAVATAPDVERVGFDSEIGDLHGLVSPSNGRLVVVGRGVEPPADGRTYELWVIDDTGATPAGTFRPDDGRVQVVADLRPGAQLGITEEPAGGSPQPTGPVLASAAT